MQLRKYPKKSKTVGKVYTAHSGQGERYYFCILHNVVGETSFDSLKEFKVKLMTHFLMHVKHEMMMNMIRKKY